MKMHVGVSTAGQSWGLLNKTAFQKVFQAKVDMLTTVNGTSFFYVYRFTDFKNI